MKLLFAKIAIRLFLLALLGGGIWLWFALSPVRHAPGVLLPNAPVQTRLGEAPATPPERLDPVAGYTLEPLAGLHLHGRVLAVKRYHDERAPLAPIAMVLGWGPMSDSAVIKPLTFALEGRSAQVRGMAQMAQEEADRNSAYVHLIPANPEVARFLGQLKVGSLVMFRGALVKAGKGGPDQGVASPLMGEPGAKWMWLQQAGPFDGQHDLAALERQAQEAEARADLPRWFRWLEAQRQALDPADANAVQRFNLEAQRYMKAAHPEKGKGSAK